MMYQIEFVQHRPVVSWAQLDGQFEYRPERGWRWLQKLALWTLRKLGCYAQEEKIAYEVFTVKPDDFMRGLWQQQRHLIELYHREGEVLLIGPEDYYAMVDQQNRQRITGPFSFESPYSYGQSILGMKVTVIPWMKGMLVVPKDRK